MVDIDITEIMKMGLFELRFEKVGSAEELVITPLKTESGFRIHSGVFKANEPENGFTVNHKMGDRYAPLHTVSYDPEDWAPEFDEQISPEFTNFENLKESLTWEESVPWHEIPEHLSWVAMDEVGIWRAYENCPETMGCQWDVYFGDQTPLSHINMPTPPDFTESLVRRPDYD